MEQNGAQEENGEIEQLRYLQSVYAQSYEELLNTISNYTAASDAAARNIEVLGKMESIKGRNILLHLESGTYVPVKIVESDSILTYVGAGYLVEKSAAEANEFLSTSMRHGSDFIKQLNAEKEKLEEALFDIAYRLEELSGQ